ELIIRPLKHKIDFKDKILLIGSCFSDNLGEKLRHFKFDVRINPNGTLFNPVSISKALSSYIACKSYNPDDLFFHDDLWKSWDHHSQFSHREQNEILRTINTS
ncbi:MAG: GSCFA domain-containing protein, partial [Sphingobacteriales bacterium]